MTTAAAVTAATTFLTVVMVMVVIMAVTVTTAATVTVFMVMTMIMAVFAVNVAMSQFFFGRFTDCHNFNVEVQVLASQHMVAINHNVIAIHFSDFDRNRALIGISQETHTHFQFVNAHEDVFRDALNQVVVVVAVSVIRANMHVEYVTNGMTFQRSFQTGDQGTMAVQVIQRRAHRRFINQHTVFCTYLICHADDQVFCYFHDNSYRWKLNLLSAGVA
jgi:hypothetical protein